MARTLPREGLSQFLRYAVVGASSTALDFGTLWLLTDGAGWGPLAANPLCFLLGVTNGFYWNRRWTFRGAKDQEPRRQYVRFLLVNLAGLLIDQAVLATALTLGTQLGLSGDHSKWGGKVLSLPLVVAWNYTANARWAFGGRFSAPRDAAVVPK